MSDFNNLSIDLETLGSRPGSVITQIGLAAFHTGGGPIVSAQIHVDPKSCVDIGMTMDWLTVRWWLQQSDESRSVLTNHEGGPIHMGLMSVLQFINNTLTPTPDFLVWGYGANFDVTLLEEAFNRCRIIVPWSYRQVMCARTLAAATNGVTRPKPVREHVAADDAVAQAELVQLCKAALRS